MEWLETWRERRKHDDGDETDGASMTGEPTGDDSKGVATGATDGKGSVDENAHNDENTHNEDVDPTGHTADGGPRIDAAGGPRAVETGDAGSAAAGSAGDTNSAAGGPEYGERATATDSAADGGQAGDSKPVIVVVDEKPIFGLNLAWVPGALAFALVMIWLVIGSYSRPASGWQAMQEDVGKISVAVSKAASERQAEVDELLYDSPKPTVEQLDELGGWKLELKQTTVKGKQHVTITNVAAPGGKGAEVWSGDLSTSGPVEIRLHAPLETVLDGGPSDKLVTRAYSITGTLKTDDGEGKGKKFEGKSDGSSATTGEAGDAGNAGGDGYSIVSLINGDSDYRMADLKAVAVDPAGSNAGEDGAARQQTAPGDEMRDTIEPSSTRGE